MADLIWQKMLTPGDYANAPKPKRQLPAVHKKRSPRRRSPSMERKRHQKGLVRAYKEENPKHFAHLARKSRERRRALGKLKPLSPRRKQPLKGPKPCGSIKYGACHYRASPKYKGASKCHWSKGHGGKSPKKGACHGSGHKFF